MLIIADSGSTKCDWKLIDKAGKEEQISTKGYNPFFYTSEVIYQELKLVFTSILENKKIDKVVFYGSGCSDEERRNTIKTALIRVFSTQKVFVHHDLLAAARATCGRNPGMAGIIGTGSNSCLYDGEDIIDAVPNLGFLIGDEGSGSYIGKTLIRAYAYREMPEELVTKFEKKYEINDAKTLIDTLYKVDHPNVYLASFSHFCSENGDHMYIRNLVKGVFDIFIKRHLQKYENHEKLKAHFVGSIAYYFKDILASALEGKGMKLGIVIKKPIDNLVAYHLNPVI